MVEHDRWITIDELSRTLGLSKESLRQLARDRGFPLKRVTPYCTPGMMESEFLAWMAEQPLLGDSIRPRDGP